MECTKFPLLIFLSIIVGCQPVARDKKELSVSLNKVTLITSGSGDGPIPPILYCEFLVKNESSQNYTFVTKGDKFDRSRSRIMILDTVSNSIIPMYATNDFWFSGKKNKIISHINLYDIGDYFGLEETFFNKMDYTEDRALLMKHCKKMLDRSIMLYIQDTVEAKKMKLFDSSVVPIKEIIQFEKANAVFAD